jgi:signal transduction histidine kinase
VDARQVGRGEELSRLRAEIEVVRAARRWLVLAADDDRRTIERDLHDGVHQRLVALAVSLQLARRAADSQPEAVKSLLEEMTADLEQALAETTLLAQRTYPVSLEARSLAALLRAAAVSAGVSASVDVAVRSTHRTETMMAVYLCWLHTLARADDETRATITVRDDDEALTFDVAGIADPSDAELERLRDRVEALGGQLTIDPEGGVRVSGRLPLA